MKQESKLKGVQKMGSDNNPRYNASGCADPTAYENVIELEME